MIDGNMKKLSSKSKSKLRKFYGYLVHLISFEISFRLQVSILEVEAIDKTPCVVIFLLLMDH